jgi:hypothetical protein
MHSRITVFYSTLRTLPTLKFNNFTCEWPPQASGHKNNRNMTILTTTLPSPYIMTLIRS